MAQCCRIPALIIVAFLAPAAWAGQPDSADVDFFETKIRPVLVDQCVECHSVKKARGGLALDSREALQKGGDSGPVVVPGKADESLLIRSIRHQLPDLKMPQKKPKLNDSVVADFVRWVNRGAVFPAAAAQKTVGRDLDWWSLRPLARPALPPKEALEVRNPIDAFILAKLREKGLKPSKEADRPTLIRRLTFDLHGLPPTPEEVEAFVKDAQSDAYERLVARLLASPRYGERMARHWLDVVHYGESNGFGMDRPRMTAWPYRDYVIRAFQDDKPYARFVQEQIAADVLFPDEPLLIPALGFAVAGPFNQSALVEQVNGTDCWKIALNLDRDDMVASVGATFLSATVHCARCHEHKFDPISQRDYYRLQAVFAGAGRTERSYEADPVVAAQRKDWQRKQALLAKDSAAQPFSPEELKTIASLQPAWEKSVLDAAAKKPDPKAKPAPTKANPVPAEMLKVLAIPRDRRTMEQSDLADRHYRRVHVEMQLAALPPPAQVWALASNFPALRNYRVPADPGPIHVLRRGDVTQPLGVVGPGALECVSTLKADFALANPKDEGSRRAALAKWLTDPGNVLTWRSIVNRMWHYHFGRGIADSPNDLGRLGSPPSHPELLDWLAVEFRDGGGSLKKLHRLIVSSAAYRQVSENDPERAKIDSDNRYLWRMNRGRLDAETLRDTLLAVSGKIDLTMGGPSVMQFSYADPNKDVAPQIRYDKFDLDTPASCRRSIYRFLFRNINDPLLEAFDAVDPSLSMAKRNVTITPLQALALYNNRFVLRQCEHLAERVEREAKDMPARIERACWLALGRPPHAQEKELLTQYATRHGLANACRILLNCNDFLFIH